MGSLTPYQTKVCQLVARGYSNRDIAMELKTSEQAVKSAVHAIFDKMGVGNRVELVNRFAPDFERATFLGRVEGGRREVLNDCDQGTSYQAQLNDIVYLAATLCSTPIGLLTIVGVDQICFRSALGMKARGAPREGSFCEHIIQGSGLFEVADATTDVRFAKHPYVTSNPNIRFYAAVPLLTSDGYALGTLCVIDRCPRTLSSEQAEGLVRLTRVAEKLILWGAPARLTLKTG
jgi:DNA-binding CsgD family transcriptional regulator